MKSKLIILGFFSIIVFLNACTKDDPAPPVATATPATQTINSGSATSIALTSSIDGTTFAWTVVQTGVTGATVGSGGFITQTLTGAGTAVYTIVPTANGAVGSSITVTITVNAVKPVATATPAAQTVNSGSPTSIALTSSVAGTTFAWTVVQTGVTGAAAGTGASIAQTLTGAGNAVYTITPTANGVAGTAITVTITVNAVVPKITYNTDIKPLLVASCAPCHVTGGTNPNKWDDYTTTKNKIATIIDRVKREQGTTGFMPRNGTKLAADKIALLEKWVTDGTLEK
jgi:hypothetical protein